MFGLLIACAAVSFSSGQWDRDSGGRGGGGGGSAPVDKSGNGQPVAAKVDPAAVAALEAAQKLFEQEGHEREAIEQFLPLIPTFENGKDYDHLVDCEFLLGEAYYYLGEWVNAQQHMQRAADLGFRYFPDQMSTYPLKVIGECQFQQEHYDEALKTFQERVQKIRAGDDKSELAVALFDVGGTLINLAREQEALPVLQDALTANNTRAAELSKPDSNAGDDERAANVVNHAEITYHLAIGYFHLAQYAQAKTYLEQAYAFFTSIKESGQTDVDDRLVAVLDDLVVTNEKLGNAADADKYRRERDSLNK